MNAPLITIIAIAGIALLTGLGHLKDWLKEKITKKQK